MFYLRSLTWGLGWGVLLAAAAGAVSELRRSRSRALVLLVFPVLLFAFLSTAERFFARWLMPAFPVLALLAGVGLAGFASQLSSRPAVRRVALAALLAGVLAQPLVGLCPTFDRKLGASGEVGRIRPVEVRMRPPEVFVRPLAHAEATALKSRAKKAKHFATRERAAILLASNVGNSVPQIAAMWMTDESSCSSRHPRVQRARDGFAGP